MRNLVNFVSTAGALVMAATPLAVVGGGMAHAQETQRISTADLDLSRAADRATFDARVRKAAVVVCRENGPIELARVAECRRAVKAQASEQVRQLRPAETAGWALAAR